MPLRRQALPHGSFQTVFAIITFSPRLCNAATPKENKKDQGPRLLLRTLRLITTVGSNLPHGFSNCSRCHAILPPTLQRRKGKRKQKGSRPLVFARDLEAYPNRRQQPASRFLSDGFRYYNIFPTTLQSHKAKRKQMDQGPRLLPRTLRLITTVGSTLPHGFFAVAHIPPTCSAAKPKGKQKGSRPPTFAEDLEERERVYERNENSFWLLPLIPPPRKAPQRILRDSGERIYYGKEQT